MATDRRVWSVWSNDERIHDLFIGADEFDHEFLWFVSRLDAVFKSL